MVDTIMCDIDKILSIRRTVKKNKKNVNVVELTRDFIFIRDIL